jgi:hypothetical protein
MVAGSFCTSVVARMNMTFSGGSSSVFSSALNARRKAYVLVDDVYLAAAPQRAGISRSRAKLPDVVHSVVGRSVDLNDVHKGPVLDAYAVGTGSAGPLPSSARQFIALARILAVDVLPVPLVPQNRLGMVVSSY